MTEPEEHGSEGPSGDQPLASKRIFEGLRRLSEPLSELLEDPRLSEEQKEILFLLSGFRQVGDMLRERQNPSNELRFMREAFRQIEDELVAQLISSAGKQKPALQNGHAVD